MRIVSTAQMKELEAMAAQMGADALRLMENAGCAAARYIAQSVAVGAKRATVLCGRGNNGGDACVVARKLVEMQAQVTLVVVSSIPSTRQSYAMYERVKDTSVEILHADFDMHMICCRIERADVLVDGVFGTGFHGEIDPKQAEIFQQYRQARGRKFALDMPSGVNADTGEAAALTLEADDTICFGAYKTGQYLSPGKEACGRTYLADIAIPKKAYEQVGCFAQLLDMEQARAWLPVRKPDSNKGDFGRLLAVCGSVGMSGAAVLSVRAALRCGAGLVTLATARSLVLPLSGLLIENMMLPLEETPRGNISAQAAQTVLQAAEKADAVLLGCGLGVCDDTAELVARVVRECEKPLILDADGINCIAGHIDILKTAKAPVILTPHPGEMARLCGDSVEQVQSSRTHTALQFAKECGATVLLKGTGSITATAQGELYLNGTGNPGLAKGGTGDVLAGMVAAFVAQGLAVGRAAALGAYLHGLTADRLAKETGIASMLASDVVDRLAGLFQELGR